MGQSTNYGGVWLSWIVCNRWQLLEASISHSCWEVVSDELDCDCTVQWKATDSCYRHHIEYNSRNWPTESQAQQENFCLHLCARRKGNSMGGLPLSDVGIRNRRGCRERRSFCPNWESYPGLQVQSPVRYPLGYRFTLSKAQYAIH